MLLAWFVCAVEKGRRLFLLLLLIPLSFVVPSHQGKEAAEAAAAAHKDKDKSSDQDPHKLLDLHLKNTLIEYEPP
jgi:hypothetical protein